MVKTFQIFNNLWLLRNLDSDDQKTEKTRCFDLLDALSCSGSLPIECATLHVLVAGNLYYYSRLVTPAIFTHRTPTTMYGVSMEPLWPPDHNLIGGFGVPASWGLGGTKEFWREIQNF